MVVPEPPTRAIELVGPQNAEFTNLTAPVLFELITTCAGSGGPCTQSYNYIDPQTGSFSEMEQNGYETHHTRVNERVSDALWITERREFSVGDEEAHRLTRVDLNTSAFSINLLVCNY